MAGYVTSDYSEFVPIVSEMKSFQIYLVFSVSEMKVFKIFLVFSVSDYRGVMLFIRASKHRQRNIPTFRELNTAFILNDDNHGSDK